MLLCISNKNAALNQYQSNRLNAQDLEGKLSGLRRSIVTFCEKKSFSMRKHYTERTIATRRSWFVNGKSERLRNCRNDWIVVVWHSENGTSPQHFGESIEYVSRIMETYVVTLFVFFWRYCALSSFFFVECTWILRFPNNILPQLLIKYMQCGATASLPYGKVQHTTMLHQVYAVWTCVRQSRTPWIVYVHCCLHNPHIIP